MNIYLNNAKAFIKKEDTDFEAILSDAEMKKRRAEEEMELAEQARAEHDRLAEELKAEREKLEREKAGASRQGKGRSTKNS